MNPRKIVSFLFLFLSLVAPMLAAEPNNAASGSVAGNASENVAMAKRNALDLAEALLNDGFRVRDGAWSVALTPKEPQLLQVTLFSGNQYWFIAAAAPPAAALQVTLYDSAGHCLKLNTWKDDLNIPGARAAEGFVAPHSGKYFVKLELLKSQEKAKAEACLVYAYK